MLRFFLNPQTTTICLEASLKMFDSTEALWIDLPLNYNNKIILTKVMLCAYIEVMHFILQSSLQDTHSIIAILKSH